MMNKNVEMELEELYLGTVEDNPQSRFSGVTTELGQILNVLSNKEINGEFFASIENEHHGVGGLDKYDKIVGHLVERISDI